MKYASFYHGFAVRNQVCNLSSRYNMPVFRGVLAWCGNPLRVVDLVTYGERKWASESTKPRSAISDVFVPLWLESTHSAVCFSAEI